MREREDDLQRLVALFYFPITRERTCDKMGLARNPTEHPEDVDEIIAEDQQEEDSEEEDEMEELNWREQLVLAAAAEMARGSDCDMEEGDSDPDYELESADEDEGEDDEVPLDDDEVKEALARFAEWKRDFVARKSTNKEAGGGGALEEPGRESGGAGSGGRGGEDG